MVFIESFNLVVSLYVFGAGAPRRRGYPFLMIFESGLVFEFLMDFEACCVVGAFGHIEDQTARFSTSEEDMFRKRCFDVVEI